jgi:hypothetical protein
MSETYDVYFGTDPGSLSLILSNTSDLYAAVAGLPLDYDTAYYWRVDATNEYGTTTGDVWSFTTLEFDPPLCIARSRATGEITTRDPDDVTTYDTGENFMSGNGRLVALAEDGLWYEGINT